MKNIKFKKDILPHLIAVLIFLLITVIYYAPMVFENKKIYQNDILQGAGANQEILEYKEETSDQALWTNGMFSGMPAYLIYMDWNDDILWTIQRAASFYIPTSARETFLAMVSFYILLLVFKVRPYLAIAGGIAFGLNSFFIVSVEAGHMWKVRAISYIPLVMAGLHLIMRKKWVIGFALTALAMALEIKANHLQITYYLALGVLIYGIVTLIYSIKEKQLADFFKSVAIAVLAVALGVLCNIGTLWTTIEYSKYSTRGKSELTQKASAGKEGLSRDYVFNWSNGIGETFTLLVPYFKGGASGESLERDSELGKVLRQSSANPAQINQYLKNAPTYWGEQPFTSGPTYIGAIVIFLMFMGIFLVDKKTKTWLIAAIILSILLSWGKNFPSFNYFMYDYFPGYNKFRSVSMAITLSLMCIPLLGFLGLEKFIQHKEKPEIKKKLLYSLAIVGGLCLLFVVASGMFSYESLADSNFPDWMVNALKADREALLRSDALRSFFFILLSGGLLFFYQRGKVSFPMLSAGLSLLILVDLITVDLRYLSSENFRKRNREQFFQKTGADEYVLRDSSHYRVLNLTSSPFNEARTSYYHSSIGGYHGAKMKRYQELVDYHIQGEIQTMISRLKKGEANMDGLSALNMLNTRYVILGQERSDVIRNNAAMGNAWLVDSVASVQTADEEIAALENIDISHTAVLNMGKFSDPGNIGDTGTIVLENYSPNELTYDYSSANASLAVFSEIYYPEGWRAYLDGEEIPILQVNYVLRALALPSGEHQIRFEFSPRSYTVGNQVVRYACILTLLSFLGGVGVSIYRRG